MYLVSVMSVMLWLVNIKGVCDNTMAGKSFKAEFSTQTGDKNETERESNQSPFFHMQRMKLN